MAQRLSWKTGQTFCGIVPSGPATCSSCLSVISFFEKIGTRDFVGVRQQLLFADDHEVMSSLNKRFISNGNAHLGVQRAMEEMLLQH